jgi:hypothetical protein
MIDAPRRLNVDDLHKIVSTLPDDMKNHDGGRMIGLANTVIVHFLGREWFEEHIRPDAPKPGFLRMDFSSDHRREATVFRVVELAESLFNLQHIEGFDACVAQMIGGAEKIESTCAMRNTDRVVSIKFYVSLLETRDNMVMHRHAYKEITNEASRFHDGRDWDLFKENSVPTSWNGLPPKWQRIFFFPNKK